MTFPLPNLSNDLTGRVALVTGASSGLGWRFAKVLAKQGAKVAVSGRRLERLEALVAEIKADGGEAAAFPVDVADAEAMIAMVGKIQDHFGVVDILINNAGIPDAQRAHKMSLELIDKVMDVNLRGPFVLSCEVARRLIDAKIPGRIVNIASVAAFEYRGGGAALYSVTKAGVIRMTEALAVEWARFHINVNAIAPGLILAGMSDPIYADPVVREARESRVPLGRLGTAEDIANAVVFLSSDQSSYMTGQNLLIDGGVTMSVISSLPRPASVDSVGIKDDQKK